MARFKLNPLTQKRIRRFKQIKRSYVALWILVILYLISLGSEFICNDKPLMVRFEEKLYFPVLKYYPTDTFLKNGENTRPDYHALREMPQFKDNPANRMYFPLFEYGPYTSVNPAELSREQGVNVDLLLRSVIFSINVTPDLAIAASSGLGPVLGATEQSFRNKPMAEVLSLPIEVRQGITARFANQTAAAVELEIPWGAKTLQVTLPAYEARNNPPKTVRLNFREITPAALQSVTLKFNAHGMFDAGDNRKNARTFWNGLEQSQRGALLALVREQMTGSASPIEIKSGSAVYQAEAFKLQVRYPFPPTWKHPLGLDNAGRDVLARILYGLRTSMTFGLLLVAVTMTLGIAAGSLQGYYGGKVDLLGQRFTEIWAALPFLYVMILLGSVYGRGFILLLICYGVFNWVGISYYMRGEFLRLRTQTFVEAAKCMGLPARKIIFKHILPNALVPVLTFFPFQLVGAIGALAALDYLGFGLPPPTPSWGELLSQGQVFRWAWWLILYPGLALFVIMLLGVFVGDGLRNAYDPKRYTWLE